ncbi:MAG: helix-turn-helix domain-containing protein [Blastomonas sp.]
MTIGANELTLLVDDPNETLAVEYKSWMLLDERKHQADLARHIAAIANFGGGSIVFGFDDDLEPSEPNPDAIAKLTRDVVSAIVKRYLEPAIQCDVAIITSFRGNRHPIIRVPAHGTVPIIAAKNGPDPDGSVQGIAGATIYIRKPGPESAPVIAGTDLTELIRRCTLHDRASIIAAISSALPGGMTPTAKIPAIDLWHDAAEAEFMKRINALAPPIDLGKRRWQFSFGLQTADSERLSFDALSKAMLEVNHEVRDTIETGWSMFYPFTKDELRPVWISDPASGDEQDFLQCSLVEHDTINNSSDFWRFSTLGMATLVCDYWEDRPRSRSSVPDDISIFDIEILRRNLIEFVRYARGMAERFGQASAMTFRCEWHGLASRIPVAGRQHSVVGRAAQVSSRTSRGSWPIGELTNNWPAIVTQLGSPIARTFEISYHLTEKAIRDEPRDLR